MPIIFPAKPPTSFDDMPAVSAWPRYAVDCGDLRANRLISIIGHEDQEVDPDTARSCFPGGLLVLRFDDVGVEEHFGYKGPSRADVETALTFARSGEGSIAIHCSQAVSRSTAVAIAILADRLGPEAAAATFQQIRTQLGQVEETAPNPRIIALADQILGLDGRLDAAVASTFPAYTPWKAHWTRHMR